MRRHLLVLMVLVLLLSVVVTAPAGADNDPGPKELPFRATADRVWAEESSSCPGGEDSYYTGTGTHLGRFELFETLCTVVDFPILTFTVDGLLVAANGDRLNFDVLGIFNLVTMELVQSSGWVFDGGTGRFESATGVAFETLFRGDAGDIIGVDAVGTISYEASDRSR